MNHLYDKSLTFLAMLFHNLMPKYKYDDFSLEVCILEM